MPEFKALWSGINAKPVYVIDFDTEELIQKAILSLNSKLELLSGSSFVKEETAGYGVTVAANSNAQYDLIGKLVYDSTGESCADSFATLQARHFCIYRYSKRTSIVATGSPFAII